MADERDTGPAREVPIEARFVRPDAVYTGPAIDQPVVLATDADGRAVRTLDPDASPREAREAARDAAREAAQQVRAEERAQAQAAKAARGD